MSIRFNRASLQSGPRLDGEEKNLTIFTPGDRNTNGLVLTKGQKSNYGIAKHF